MRASSILFSAELEGLHARVIEIEVDLNAGLHAFTIVGLADKALNEARERVNSALKNSGIKPPNREHRKIIVNLAPADLKKSGSQHDLAIAIGYLLATGQISRFEAEDKIFLGELALDGRLRPVSGALSMAEMAAASGFHEMFLPRQNAAEACVIPGIRIVPIGNLKDALKYLAGEKPAPLPPVMAAAKDGDMTHDLSEIHGQENAKRALIIAASGRHNLLMVGPPGVGKSFLAQALSGMLPSPSLEESIEITKIWSAAGMKPAGLIRVRPFRSPPQSVSQISMIGGGREPRPGEVSLAHRGVLFLDEISEFPRSVIESLRGPLENGASEISRAKGKLVFPAAFLLVATMNPCPCGFRGDPEKECRCTAGEILRHDKKISGPLLDRIDMQIRLARVPIKTLTGSANLPDESFVAKRNVFLARNIQRKRFQGLRPGLWTNADMSPKEIGSLVDLSPAATRFLDNLQQTTLSPRGYYRLLKTARTIADLEGRAAVSENDLAEAWGYRIRSEERS